MSECLISSFFGGVGFAVVVIIELRNLRIVALDQTTARRVPLLRRQRETGILAQRIDRLDKTLAETRFADDQSAIVILQRAGNNFRCAGALRIDQNHQWESVVGVQLLRRVRTVGTSRAAARLDDQLSLLQEGFANFDGFLKQSARIAAKIENQAIEFFRVALSQFIAKFFQRIAQFLAGRFGKAIEFDVANARYES